MSRPFSPLQVRVGDVFIKWMSRVNTVLYRSTGGRVGGRFLRGAPVCLVTTKGRKTGRARTVPLLYLHDGDDVVIVASKGGMPEHPLWYLNLLDDPHATIEVGREHFDVTCRTATFEERARLWPELVGMYRDYDFYQARTDREIPVVICSPESPIGAADGA